MFTIQAASALIIFSVHEQLYDIHGFLHGNISYSNILMVESQALSFDDRRKRGLLIDRDYATKLKLNAKGINRDRIVRKYARFGSMG